VKKLLAPPPPSPVEVAVLCRERFKLDPPFREARRVSGDLHTHTPRHHDLM